MSQITTATGQNILKEEVENVTHLMKNGKAAGPDDLPAIYIRVNNSTLNNNIGKFNLSHIWDRVLLNTKGITLNKQGNNNNNQTN